MIVGDFDRITTEHGDAWYDGDAFIGYVCMECARPVWDWSADDVVWQDVMDGGWDAGHICADCFMMRAHMRDIHVTVVRWISP